MYRQGWDVVVEMSASSRWVARYMVGDRIMRHRLVRAI